MRKTILLFLFFILLALSSCDTQRTGIVPVIGYERGDDTEDIVLENDFLELRFLPETAGIILKDKLRGAEWHSTPPGASTDQMANPVTLEMMNSQFSLQYSSVSGVGEIWHSSVMSIAYNAYEYGVVDGGLEVNYTVGVVDPTFLIPTVAPEERMLVFLGRMGEDDRRFATSIYRLYDPDNLRAGEDKTALIAQYPDLADGKTYVLGDVRDFMKARGQGIFENAGYTLEDYYEDSARYVPPPESIKPAFTVTLRYTLEGKSLLVSVPFDRIAYTPSYPVVRLDLLPYFGAGGPEDSGYLFVPDGSGALIYFNNGRQNQIAFDNPVYGWDEAMPRDAVVIDSKAPYPAFGVQRNGTALLGVIEEGSAYASVRADVSGRNSSYNNVYPYFSLVHGALMDITDQQTINLYESGLPLDERIVVRYVVCGGEGYVGMAKEYRAWLLEKYPRLAERPAGGNVPVAIEIIGAVNKTQHRLGIPFDLPLKLTSYREAENMIRDLAALGWKGVQVKITGWFNKGYEHGVPNKIRLIGELGSRRDFNALVSAAERNGYDLYPEADFMFIRNLSLFDAFSRFRDVARYVNRSRVEKYPFSFVWFGERNRWGNLGHLARPAVSMGLIDRFMAEGASLGLKNVAFRSMGSSLAGDYNENRLISREAAMNMRQDKFADLSDSGSKIMVNAGFSYSIPWAGFITDMALDDQGFGITDVSVPFYQIALSGLVPYAGRAINLAEDYTMNLLKTIEAGAGLYFSFIAEETVVLQETKFRQFYSNEYGKWIADADALYRRFSVDFAGLYGQAIADHVILSPNVTATVYENGERVIVNRNDYAFDYSDSEGRVFTVAANSYIVRR